MNTLSGRDQLSDVSASDANLHDTDNVSDADRAFAVSSVPTSDSEVAPAVSDDPVQSVSTLESPDMCTGYPILTIPTPGASPSHKPPSKSLHTGSPRNLHSPRRSRLLEGQRHIDHFFQSVSNRASSEISLSSLPLSRESLISKFQSYSPTLERKHTQPNEVFESPLLSRYCENFVQKTAPDDSQSTRIFHSNTSNNGCNRTEVQRETSLFSAVTPNETDLVSQFVAKDVDPKIAAMKSTEKAAAEVQLGCSKVESEVSSDLDSQSAAVKTRLKLSKSKFETLRQTWGESLASVFVKSAKTCSSASMTSEAPVLSSSLAVGTEVTSVAGNKEASSVAPIATSTEVSTSKTVSSMQKHSTGIDRKIGGTVAREQVDMYCTDQQNMCNPGVCYKNCESLSVSAANKDVSNVVYCVTDSKATNSAMAECSNSVKTISVSAANEAQFSCLTGQPTSNDNQMDVDTCTLGDSEDSSYAPVESKSFSFTLS